MYQFLENSNIWDILTLSDSLYMSRNNLCINMVTWMGTALLGNWPLNTSRPNTRKATIRVRRFLCGRGHDRCYAIVREGAPQKQDRNSGGAINLWSWAPGGCWIPRLTDWLTVSRNVTWTWTWSCNQNCQQFSWVKWSEIAGWWKFCWQRVQLNFSRRREG
jgi:hypothetical protein